MRESQKDKYILAFFKAPEFGNRKCYFSGTFARVLHLKAQKCFF